MFDSLTVLDGILALILLVGVIVGIKLGFIGFVAKPVKLVAAGALTVCVSGPILDAWTRPWITQKVNALIYDTLIEKCPELTGETATSALPAFLRFLANIFKVDVSTLGADATSEELIRAITTALSTPLGNHIAVTVTYFALFTIFTIILSILVHVIDAAVASAGPLAFINRLLGFIIGAALAIVVSCIIANVAGHFSEGVPGGFVYTFFKNFNPFEILARIQIK